MKKFWDLVLGVAAVMAIVGGFLFAAGKRGGALETIGGLALALACGLGLVGDTKRQSRFQPSF